MPRQKAPKPDVPPRRRSKKPNRSLFNTYIYKVLKQVHPDVGISNHAMTISNDFVQYTLRRIAEQAQILADLEKSRT